MGTELSQSNVPGLIRKALEGRELTIALIVILFVLQAAIRFNSYLNPDVAWYLYAGGQLMDGAKYYVDIIDTISPYVIWLSMPVAALSQAIGVNVAITLHVVLLSLTAISIVLSARMIAVDTEISASTRHLFLILLTALMLFLPASDFGRSDHVVIVLATPWVFLRWNRFADHHVPWTLALAIGLMAAVGLWMNWLFLIVVLALEITVLFSSPRIRLALRIESLAIVAFGVVYALALWLSASGASLYVSLIGMRAVVPIYRVEFGEFGLRLILVTALLAVAIASARFTAGRLRLLQAILIVVGTGFVFTFVVRLGFHYQAIPALFFLALAAGLGLIDTSAKAPKFATPLEPAAAAASAAAIFILFANIWSVQSVPYQGRQFESAIAAVAPSARSIFIATTDTAFPFPLIHETGLIWASRFSSQWLAPHIATELDEDGRPADDIGRMVLTSTFEDLEKFKPEIVFVDERPVRAHFTGRPLDFVEFWQSDDKFFFYLRKNYRRHGVMGEFAIYVRNE